MSKADFIYLVRQEIAAHPEWMSDVVMAIQAGVEERLRLEVEARARSETALVVVYNRGKSRLNPSVKAMVEETLSQSLILSGTPLQETIRLACGKGCES